jgi:hypothetical protein
MGCGVLAFRDLGFTRMLRGRGLALGGHRIFNFVGMRMFWEVVKEEMWRVEVGRFSL